MTISSLKRRVSGGLYGLWLTALSVVFYLGGSMEAGAAVELALIAGLVPAAAQLCLYRVVDRLSSACGIFVFLFIASLVISYIGHIEKWTSIVLLVNVVFVFALAILLASCPDDDHLEEVFAVYALSTSLFLLYVNLYGEFVWGRLTAGLHPNHWGFLAVSAGVAAFALTNPGVRLFCFGVALVTIYNASARGSLLALSVGFLVALYLWMRRRAVPQRFLLVPIAGLLAGTLFLSGLIPGTESFVEHQLLRLDDPNRGLGSGFTGRLEGWIETLEIWSQAPLFGVGYRLHEEQVTIGSAHNAFLAVLADTGLFGLIIYLAFIGAALRANLRDVPQQGLQRVLLVTIVAYAAVGLFERRALNTGNPFSIMFVIACFYALNAKVRARVAERAQPDLPVGKWAGRSEYG